MKILILANKFPYPPRDGGAIATHQLIRGLSAAGNEVTVLAINTSKHYFDIKSLPEEEKKLAEYISVEVNTNLSVFKLLKNLFFSSLPYNAERFIHKDVEKALEELCRRKSFDVIQLEGLYVCPYIPLIRRLSKAKISLRAHNVETEIWKRMLPLTDSFIRRKYLRILTKRMGNFEVSFINKYDFLVPISSKDKEWFEQAGNKKPVFISQTGIDLQNTALFENIEYPSVFFLGGLDWIPNQQGLKWFIDNCWKEIVAALPEIKLYIAGRNASKSFSSYLKKTQNIEFLGEISDARSLFMYKAIMIVPLFAGSGMRIKIMEGMGYGKAIITTAIGLEGIDATDKQEVMIADDSKGFVTSILELSTNRDLYHQITKNAYNFASAKFDNMIITKSLSDFYNKYMS